MTNRHPTLARLLDAAAALPKPISGPTALARALGEASATVTNWGARGVSKRAAARAQEVLGVSSTWTLSGIEPMLVATEPGQYAGAPNSKLRSLEQDIHALRLALAAMAAVMVEHRPAEAAALVDALGQLPEEYSNQGLARTLAEALEPALQRQGKARPSGKSP